MTAAGDGGGSGFLRRKTVTAHNDASMRTVVDFGARCPVMNLLLRTRLLCSGACTGLARRYCWHAACVFLSRTR